MTPNARKGPPVGRRRRVVSLEPESSVDVRPLWPDRPFPTLITPRAEGLSLPAWAAANREWLEELWREKRAILFRGFELGAFEGFGQVVDALSDGPRLPYRDRSTPRETHGDNVYCTTIYPPEYPIRLHNEGSYWAAHPLKAFFSCITAPKVGGATPIGDVHAVHNRIAPEIREEFRRRKWMLVRNYNAGFGLPWEEVFQTNDRTEVESYCRENKIEFEWLSGETLRTRSVRTPILDHPRTGEALWHNHAAFFHVSTREPEMQRALLEEFGEDALPYNTYYGDGGQIPDEVVAELNRAYDEELVAFPWEEGDVHWIDNLRIAHARETFEGERLILVALTEAFVPSA